MRRFSLALFGFVYSSLAMAADTLPYYASEDFTPHWVVADAAEIKHFHRIPDFSFTNQDGKSVTSESYQGKIYVASFFFTSCPGICPALTTRLSAVQKAFVHDDQVRILTHTAMPDVDTVAVLRKYADVHKIRRKAAEKRISDLNCCSLSTTRQLVKCSIQLTSSRVVLRIFTGLRVVLVIPVRRKLMRPALSSWQSVGLMDRSA